MGRVFKALVVAALASTACAAQAVSVEAVTAELSSQWYGATDADRIADAEDLMSWMVFKDGDGTQSLHSDRARVGMVALTKVAAEVERPEEFFASAPIVRLLELHPVKFTYARATQELRSFLRQAATRCAASANQPGCRRMIAADAEISAWKDTDSGLDPVKENDQRIARLSREMNGAMFAGDGATMRARADEIEAALDQPFTQDYTIDGVRSRIAAIRLADGEYARAEALQVASRVGLDSTCDVILWSIRNPAASRIPSGGLPGCEVKPAELQKKLRTELAFGALRGGRDPGRRKIAAKAVIEFMQDLRAFANEALAGDPSQLPTGTMNKDDVPLFQTMIGFARANADPASVVAAPDAFYQMLQETMFDQSARNVAASAAERVALERGPEVARLVREYQDNFSNGRDPGAPRPRIPGVEPTPQTYTVQSRQALTKSIVTKFPEFFSMLVPQALTVQATQKLLKPDEAVVMLVPHRDGTMIVVVTPDRFRFEQGKWSAREVEQAVQRLRWDMGADVGAPETVETRWAKAAGPGNGFDRKLAHALYQELFAPIAAQLAGKRNVFIVADGSLESIPMQMLVTAPPQGLDSDPAALRATAWMADQGFSLSYLPSVQALSLQRSGVLARGGTKAAQAFAGFGDPQLSQVETPRVVETRGGRPRAAAKVRGGEPLTSLSQMVEIPGTGRELEAMRAALGAPAQSVVVGAAATEQAVRTHGIENARILHFATHGLLPGELAGLREAALVFTPGPSQNPEDDGLLKASEIAQLKLDADWVILSACNSGATDLAPLAASQAAGLPEGFIYAGALNLLVSHWPVQDEVAEVLTVATVTTALADPQLSRAEALTKAMRQIRNDTRHDGADDDQPTWAHPSAWASFVLIGDNAKQRPAR